MADRFTYIPLAVIDMVPTLGATAFGLYVVLADMADESGECLACRSVIAERLGVSERSVGSSLAKLRSAGLVEVNRKRESNHYRLPRQAGLGGHADG
jgi:DNA-binding transcriptional ArsR family regulator